MNTISEIANTPKPPYYAVIFTSHRTAGDNDYGKVAARMGVLISVPITPHQRQTALSTLIRSDQQCLVNIKPSR